MRPTSCNSLTEAAARVNENNLYSRESRQVQKVGNGILENIKGKI